jgi:hypothetical protein
MFCHPEGSEPQQGADWSMGYYTVGKRCGTRSLEVAIIKTFRLQAITAYCCPLHVRSSRVSYDPAELALILLVNNLGGELVCWYSSLEQDVQLSERPAFTFGKPEVCPDEDHQGRSAPEETTLAFPVPGGWVHLICIEHIRRHSDNVVPTRQSSSEISENAYRFREMPTVLARSLVLLVSPTIQYASGCDISLVLPYDEGTYTDREIKNEHPEHYHSRLTPSCAGSFFRGE